MMLTVDWSRGELWTHSTSPCLNKWLLPLHSHTCQSTVLHYTLHTTPQGLTKQVSEIRQGPCERSGCCLRGEEALYAVYEKPSLSRTLLGKQFYILHKHICRCTLTIGWQRTYMLWYDTHLAMQDRGLIPLSEEPRSQSSSAVWVSILGSEIVVMIPL